MTVGGELGIAHPLLEVFDRDAGPPPLLESLLADFVARLRAALEGLFVTAEAIDKRAVLGLRTAWGDLPDAWRVHLLLSPAFFRELTACAEAPSAEGVRRVLQLLLDEVAVATAPPDDPADGEAVWTPLGDVLLHRGGTAARTVRERIDSVLLLDFDSPNATRIVRSSIAFSVPPQRFLDDERAAAVAKLSDALAHIDTVSAVYGVLVRNFTRSIVCRKVTGDLSSISEQDAGTLGEIRLVNPHRSNVNVMALAAAFAYESIRNFVSTYEYVAGSFLVEREDARYRPVSPWTGMPLLAGSFCADAIASYGLYRFACRELEQRNLNAGQRLAAVRRRNRYASGFVVPAALSEHVRESATFDAGPLAMLDAMQNAVREDVTRCAVLQRSPDPPGAT